jgi:choline dehydrogenase-like flavoprotein
MSIIDANTLESDSVLAADICIVGAGAAGITLCSAFAGTSLSVCLLESGSARVDEDAQSLCDIDVAGHPVQVDFMSRARYFGGTCNLWAGRSMKLTAFDFERRPWVSDSGWPIAYDDLTLYYERAAAILKIPSTAGFAHASLEGGMSTTEQALLANGDLEPTVSLWARRPLRFGAAYRAALKRSRNVSVCLNATVTELMLDRAGQSVHEARVATLGGKRLRVRSKRFVLACGGLENARLLLLSRSVQENGIGNSFDVVGRYFMDHPRAVFGTVRLDGRHAFPLVLGAALRDGLVQVGVRLSENLQRREGLLNSYLTLERRWSPLTADAYQSFVRSMKILLRRGYAGRRVAPSQARLARVPESIYLFSPRELMPHWAYRAVKAARNGLDTRVSELNVVNYAEQAPARTSRVYLSGHRDRLGMNRLVLDWRIGTGEHRTLARLHERLDHHLRGKHIGTLTAPSNCREVVFSDACHHIGTTRMSADPRTGVVDDDCKVHGVRNLFIAGSSVFPTSGHANPTWTIVALSLRLADHLRARAAVIAGGGGDYKMGDE